MEHIAPAYQAMFEECEARFRLLKRQHNTRAPIARLPTETLSEIFLLAQEMNDGLDKMLPPVSHTCHTWRAVALTCPALWTFVDCSYVALAKALVSRAHTLPLELSVANYMINQHSHEDCMIPDATRFAIEHLHQAWSLVIWGCWHKGHPDLPKDVQWPEFAPYLEHLEVSRGGAHYDLALEDYSLSDLCPQTRFPKLSYLNSYWCAISWKSRNFFRRSLTKLVLRGIQDDRVNPHTTDTAFDLLQALQCMPGLEHLEIVWFFLSAGGFDSTTELNMPSLHTLILESSEPILSRILSSLPFPRDHLRVDCHPEPANATALIQYLANYRVFQTDCGHPLLAAEIKHTDSYGWNISVFEAGSRVEGFTPPLQAVFSGLDFLSTVAEFGLGFPTSTLTEVWFLPTMSSLDYIWPNLERLETMHIVKWTAKVIAEVYEMWGLEDENGNAYFHYLRTVYFEQCTLGEENLEFLIGMSTYVSNLHLMDCKINPSNSLDSLGAHFKLFCSTGSREDDSGLASENIGDAEGKAGEGARGDSDEIARKD